MSEAILGYGSSFQTGDGNSPEGFTAFGEVNTMSLPTASIDTIDTSHEMPPESVREPMHGMKDWGDITINFNYVPTSPSTAQLFAEIATTTVKNRRVVFPTGNQLNFAAFIARFESNETAADKLTGTATFRLVGAPTFT